MSPRATGFLLSQLPLLAIAERDSEVPNKAGAEDFWILGNRVLLEGKKQVLLATSSEGG